MFEERPDRDAEVVFAGRSNVGKSTLMRELTGHTFDTGQKPGVTRSPNHYDWAPEDFVLTDLPGFGFMSGVDEDHREAIKDGIVEYIEDRADNILVAVIVLDGKSAVDIIDRHSDEDWAATAASPERASGPADEVPYVLDMYYFFQDLGIPTVIAVNKMDKVDDRDERLDEICERFGLYPPWQQWQETVAPITAKTGDIDALEEAIRHHLHEQERDDLFKFF